MAQEMFKTLHYYWNAARGYRFRPWQSPYVRWRFDFSWERSSRSDRREVLSPRLEVPRPHGTLCGLGCGQTPLSTPAPRLKLEHIPSTNLNQSGAPLRLEL